MLTRAAKGSDVYAVLSLSGSMDKLDKVSYMMINSNRNMATGLAPIRIDALNGKFDEILFEVTGKITLREYVSKNMSQPSFRKMLINLIDTIEGLDDYMIDLRQIMLDIDSVYINEVDKTTSFICVPVADISFDGDIYCFFKDVINESRVEMSGSISYHNAAHNVIIDRNGFSLKNMRMAMEIAQSKETKLYQDPIGHIEAKSKEKIVEEPEVIKVSAEALPVPEAVTPLPPVQGKLGKLGFFKKIKKNEKNESKSNENFSGGIAGFLNKETASKQNAAGIGGIKSFSSEAGASVTPAVLEPKQTDDTILNIPLQTNDSADLGTIMLGMVPETPEDAGDMTILMPPDSVNEANEERAVLIRQKNLENIEINKPQFFIGRGDPSRDYCINDNMAVGHKHAMIEKREHDYYLIDLNSRNHTYLNEAELEPQRAYKLSSSDKIAFADEEFEMRILGR